MLHPCPRSGYDDARAPIAPVAGPLQCSATMPSANAGASGSGSAGEIASGLRAVAGALEAVGRVTDWPPVRTRSAASSRSSTRQPSQARGSTRTCRASASAGRHSTSMPPVLHSIRSAPSKPDRTARSARRRASRAAISRESISGHEMDGTAPACADVLASSALEHATSIELAFVAPWSLAMMGSQRARSGEP